MSFPLGQTYSLEQIAMALYKGHEGKHIVPSLVGTWLACLAQGVVMMQFSRWWKHSSMKDPIGTRAVVYFGMLVITTDTIFMIIRIMYMNVLAFGLYERFVEVNWSTPGYLFMLVTRVPTTAYLIHRTWLISKSKIVLAINVVLTLGYAATQLWDYIKLVRRPFDEPLDTTPSFFWGAFKVAGSVFLSGSMMWYFLRSRTGWRTTDKLLTKLSLLVIHTQLPPTIFAIVYIALNIANIPDGPSPYGLMFLCEPHVMVSSMLLLLNSRQTMVSITTYANEPVSFPLQSMHKSKLGGGTIHVTTETTWKDQEGRSVLPVMDKGGM